MSTITEVLSQGEHLTSSELSSSIPSATPSAGETSHPDTSQDGEVMVRSLHQLKVW